MIGNYVLICLMIKCIEDGDHFFMLAILRSQFPLLKTEIIISTDPWPWLSRFLRLPKEPIRTGQAELMVSLAEAPLLDYPFANFLSLHRILFWTARCQLSKNA